VPGERGRRAPRNALKARPAMLATNTVAPVYDPRQGAPVNLAIWSSALALPLAERSLAARASPDLAAKFSLRRGLSESPSMSQLTMSNTNPR
jgi:hypothetical protein